MTSIGPGAVHTAGGHRVSARHVIRATEAWTPGLPGQRRAIAPVYSLMVATEPIPASTWDSIGLAGREVFADHRHVVIYGQRTADDRIAFGGRGAPYHWGSRIRPGFDREGSVFDDLRATLTQMLPQLDGVGFTHAWGGPLGIARDWHPSVGLDTETGLGWAGGTSETASPPATSRAGPWPTWCAGGIPRSPPCPGSGTAPVAGSPSRCGGSASTAACASASRPTARRSAPAAPRAAHGSSARSPGTDRPDCPRGPGPRCPLRRRLAFLAARHLATLTTLRPDGSPHAVPVGFTWDAGARVARVITSGTSRKARNAAAGRRAVLCQVEGRHWLSLEGPTRVLTSPEAVRDAEERYAARYRVPRENPLRVVVEIGVDRVLGNL